MNKSDCSAVGKTIMDLLDTRYAIPGNPLVSVFDILSLAIRHHQVGEYGLAICSLLADGKIDLIDQNNRVLLPAINGERLRLMAKLGSSDPDLFDNNAQYPWKYIRVAMREQHPNRGMEISSGLKKSLETYAKWRGVPLDAVMVFIGLSDEQTKDRPDPISTLVAAGLMNEPDLRGPVGAGTPTSLSKLFSTPGLSGNELYKRLKEIFNFELEPSTLKPPVTETKDATLFDEIKAIYDSTSFDVAYANSIKQIKLEATMGVSRFLLPNEEKWINRLVADGFTIYPKNHSEFVWVNLRSDN